MVKMDTTPKLFNLGEAVKFASDMNASDDWTYKVKHDPKGTGYSLIEIYDEDNEFVGYWC